MAQFRDFDVSNSLDIEWNSTPVLTIEDSDAVSEEPSTSNTRILTDLNNKTEEAGPTITRQTTSCDCDPKGPVLECPICLQICIHPARLPCGHIFCFLCIKGVAYKNRRCAMCRREIPLEFLDRPQLVNGMEDLCKTKITGDGFQWFYEGRNGWWQYDDRTSQDIEDAFKRKDKSCTILVAGYVYNVDLENMLQQRQNEPARCRRVKRDLCTIPKKGVAGLRIAGTFYSNASRYPSQMVSRILEDPSNQEVDIGNSDIEETTQSVNGQSNNDSDSLLNLSINTNYTLNANINTYGPEPSTTIISNRSLPVAPPQTRSTEKFDNMTGVLLEDSARTSLQNVPLDDLGGALNSFHTLSIRDIVDSSDEDDDVNERYSSRRIQF